MRPRGRTRAARWCAGRGTGGRRWPASGRRRRTGSRTGLRRPGQSRLAGSSLAYERVEGEPSSPIAGTSSLHGGRRRRPPASVFAEPVDEPGAPGSSCTSRTRRRRLEVVAGRLHRLLGEEVALEAERRLARHERDRVRQREQDQVVLLVGALEERAAVVDVGRRRAGRRRAGPGGAPRRARAAGGRSRPRRRARPRCAGRRATSLPPPAPITSTSSRLPGLRDVVDALCSGANSVGLMALVGDAVDVDLEVAAQRPPRTSRDLVVRRPARVRLRTTRRRARRAGRRAPATWTQPPGTPEREVDDEPRRRRHDAPGQRGQPGGRSAAEKPTMPGMLPRMSTCRRRGLEAREGAGDALGDEAS